MTFLRAFHQDEGGAVTVDWVILTGCMITMGLMIVGSVRNGAGDLSTDVRTALINAEIASLVFE